MIQKKKKICKKCGNERFIFSKGMCKYCAGIEAKEIKSKDPYKVELDEFFSNIIKKSGRLVRSEESGEAIYNLRKVNICHLFPKRNHKSIATNPLNYIILTIDEHFSLDNKCFDIMDFESLPKLFPNSYKKIINRMRTLLPEIKETTKFKEKFIEFLTNFN